MPEALARWMALCDGAADPPFSRLVRGAPVPVERAAPDLPAAMRPGALLYADAWDAAHEAAQADGSVLGSWWHAILHRREPDADNAMYWYRRARIPGPHAARLGGDVDAVLRAAPVPGLDAGAGAFDPGPFVRACEAARAGRLPPAAIGGLVAIQRLEWRAAMELAGGSPT